MPTISVIIPTFNRASLVEEAIRSVLSQTFKDFEVIVVDDGSTDNTKEKLRQFEHLRNFRYYYQQSKGRSAARNAGIEMARGEFLLFLDSDDLLLPGALHCLHRIGLEYPVAGLVVGESQITDLDGNMVRFLGPQLNPRNGKVEFVGFAYPILLRKKYFLPGSYLLRTAHIQKVGFFDPDLNYCEDLDFCLRAALHWEVVYTHTYVVQHRMHGNNTPSSHFPISRIKVAEKHLKLIDELDRYPLDVKKIIRCEWILNMADDYYTIGMNLKALTLYLRATVIRPGKILDFHVLRQLLASLLPLSMRNILKAAKDNIRDVRNAQHLRPTSTVD